MSISIAVISPSSGIGGGDRKFKIYYKHLSTKQFKKYLIFFTNTEKIEKKKEGYYVSKELIPSFLNKKNIQYAYVSPQVGESTLQKIKKVSTVLWNVNFTPLYREDNNLINLVISKTDYWKIRWAQNKPLKNTYVVYNPIDYAQWTQLAKTTKPIYREFFKGKHIKHIVGRLGRAEPTKWNYLNIATLLKLQKQKNYSYGFIYAGMPLLYRKILKLTLNKKMKENVLLLPELKEFSKLAEFYQSIDLFWQTSRIGESFGNVIAESFSFEKPVITDYKGFLEEDGTLNLKKYDAQIELVEHHINGAYVNYPQTIISFLEQVSKGQLKKWGKAGKKKVKEKYDAKHAGNTISNILSGTITTNNTIPSQDEVAAYAQEYKKRLKIARKENKISSKELRKYHCKERMWHGIEFMYVSIRKILRVINIDLEKSSR